MSVSLFRSRTTPLPMSKDTRDTPKAKRKSLRGGIKESLSLESHGALGEGWLRREKRKLSPSHSFSIENSRVPRAPSRRNFSCASGTQRRAECLRAPPRLHVRICRGRGSRDRGVSFSRARRGKKKKLGKNKSTRSLSQPLRALRSSPPAISPCRTLPSPRAPRVTSAW